MKLDFTISDLRVFLEHELGFGIAALKRLPGRSSSLNFVATRMSDGLRFVIKCLPASREKIADRLTAIDKSLEGCPFLAHRLFLERGGRFQNYRVSYYEFCKGEKLRVGDLDAAWLDGLIHDYKRLAEGLQQASAPRQHKDLRLMHAIATGELKGLGAKPIMRLVRQSAAVDDLHYDTPIPVVIHGDFHAGNLFFSGGRLSGVVDLENVCYGYPTEDFVRFFTCLIEHCGLFSWRKRRRLLELFGQTTKLLGCSRHEWMVALDGIILSRVATRGGIFGVGMFEAVEELRKILLYRKMKELV